MPVTNYGGSILTGIRDKLLGLTNEWPADPRNVIEGYRSLMSSKTPGRDYLNAGREMMGNMGRDTQKYLDRVNSGDPEALMPFFLMNNPIDPKEIAQRVKERLLMNRNAGRPIFEGIDPTHLDIAEQAAKVGKAVKPNEDFATWAKGIGEGKPPTPVQATTEASEGLQGLMTKDYGKLTDKERNFVNNALSPEYLKMLLPFLAGTGYYGSQE